MKFMFHVEVEVERDSGKFAARSDIDDQLRESLESADPGSVDGLGADGDSTYSVVNWEVTSEQ